MELAFTRGKSVVPVRKLSDNTTDDSNSLFWIRMEILEEAVLSLPLPHNTFNSVTLHHLASALKQEAISFGDWLQIATAQLYLSEDVAIVLFETFETLQFSEASQQLSHTRKELAAIKNNQADEFYKRRQVKVGKFLLFLFLQLYHRSSLRSPRQANEAWPSETVESTNINSPYSHPHSTGKGSLPGGELGSALAHLSPTRNFALQNRVGEHSEQFYFVKKNLGDLLMLLAASSSSSIINQNNMVVQITADTLDDLGLVIAGGYLQKEEKKPLHSLLPCFKTSTHCDIKEIVGLIQQRLNGNQTMYPAILSGIKQMPQSPTSTPSISISSPVSSPRVVFNSVDFVETPNSKYVSVSGVHKNMVVKTKMGQNTSIMKIYCCNQSYIYILTPLEYVHIFGCVNCTIVLGPVAKVLNIEHCEHTRVIATCRSLTISNSLECNLFVCVNASPVVFNNNTGIKIAPYNTHYNALEEHLIFAGVNPRLNKWKKGKIVNKANDNKNSNSGNIWSILPPKDFSSFVTPFEVEIKTNQPPTQTNPCILPGDYSNELVRKIEVASTLCARVRATSKACNVGNELHNAVNNSFREWLISSGNLRHVLDLLHFENKK